MYAADSRICFLAVRVSDSSAYYCLQSAPVPVRLSFKCGATVETLPSLVGIHSTVGDISVVTSNLKQRKETNSSWAGTYTPRLFF